MTDSSKFWRPRRNNAPTDVENGVPLETQNKRHDLIRVMAYLDQKTPLLELQRSSSAYLRFLDATLDEIPDSLLRAIYTASLTDRSKEGVRMRLYSMLVLIAEALRDQKGHVFVRRLCVELEKRDFIQNSTQTPREGDGDLPSTIKGYQEEIVQLLFILFGALTMLYSPVSNPEPGKLQMRTTGLITKLKRRNTATWQTGSQDLSSFGPDTSFDDLLCRYCLHHYGPIPKPKTPLQHPQANTHRTSNILRSQDVSFYTLSKLLKITISWTSSICEHLEFNVKTKTLKIFRFPSFCLILCLLEPDKTFLDCLFKNFLEDEVANLVPADFFREVISTYRLIFGQHKDARKLIRKYCAQGKLFGFKSPFKNENPSAFVKHLADPLLEDLCFKDSRNETTFEDLDMLDLKNIYVLDVDFPYFADRLSALQSFVENQCPHDWKVLWRDRRDISKFWAIWAVTLFGVPTMLLAILQVVLGGFQIRSSH